MLKIKDYIKQNYAFLILLAVTVWLRVVNLGYSDYQGDEIKALFSPSSGQGIWEYLQDQRKGPVQFLITYTLSIIDPLYSNQFLFRLPFALAGILGVVVFYKLVNLFYGKKVAFYAALLFSINGFLVAFSRIVQYQTVTIMFALLAVYLFALAVKRDRWLIHGVYLGMLSWSASILTHFDGGFIAPIVAYLLIRWLKLPNLTLKVKLLHLLTSGILFLVMLGSFFVPYVSSVSDATKGYWLDRISGGFGRASSSQLTFKVYNPLFVLYGFYFFVFAALPKIKSYWPIILWALFPLFIWEFVTTVPGTHIYNYLIPLFIVAGIGIVFIEEFLAKFSIFKYTRMVFIFFVLIFLGFWFLLSSQVFVDNKAEYPWEEERFLLWTLGVPDQNYHLSLFGFPYYRAWEEIASYVNAKNNGFYSTNERVSISRFYIPLAKSTDQAGHYVTIINPQSYSKEQISAKAIYWAAKYQPDKVITRNGRILAKIYLMPAGNTDAIVLFGY